MVSDNLGHESKKKVNRMKAPRCESDEMTISRSGSRTIGTEGYPTERKKSLGLTLLGNTEMTR